MYKFLTKGNEQVVKQVIKEKGKYLTIENYSKFGITVWKKGEIIDLVRPFSTVTLENEVVSLETNEQIKSEIDKGMNEYVSIKTSMIIEIQGKITKEV